MSSEKWWNEVDGLREKIRDMNAVVARVGWDRSLESAQRYCQDAVDEMDRDLEREDGSDDLEAQAATRIYGALIANAKDVVKVLIWCSEHEKTGCKKTAGDILSQMAPPEPETAESLLKELPESPKTDFSIPLAESLVKATALRAKAKAFLEKKP
jgi:hypothetical protein